MKSKNLFLRILNLYSSHIIFKENHKLNWWRNRNVSPLQVQDLQKNYTTLNSTRIIEELIFKNWNSYFSISALSGVSKTRNFIDSDFQTMNLCDKIANWPTIPPTTCIKAKMSFFTKKKNCTNCWNRFLLPKRINKSFYNWFQFEINILSKKYMRQNDFVHLTRLKFFWTFPNKKAKNWAPLSVSPE